MNRFSQQHGVAVITVLLALAIAVVISSEVIMRVYAGIRRSENSFNSQQAWQYALGGEASARQILAADFEKDKQVKVDHLLEDWAMPAQKIEIEGGSVKIEVYDAQARFNLNNLVDEKGIIQSTQVRVFNRMLAYLGVRPIYADLAARWASYANDADDQYANDKTPYRPGDTQFGSVSELRQLRDIEMKEYKKMLPFISVLPAPVTVNINTASEPVLAGLAGLAGGNPQQLSERLQAFLDRREQQKEGYPSAKTFISMMGIQDNTLEELLGVRSQYFEVRVIVEYNDRRCWLISTLFRDEETGEISLLSRDTSQRFEFAIDRLDNESDGSDKKNDKDKKKKDKNKDSSPDKWGGNDGKDDASEPEEPDDMGNDKNQNGFGK
jgi:general secretion pathway protein K